MRIGDFVEVRGRPWLVEDVSDAAPLRTARLACIADDAQGETLEILPDAEVAARRIDVDAWHEIGRRGTDEASVLSAYLRVIQWSSATAAERDLFQAPFRAGIRLDSYQLLPLRKALRLPRVNLLIADDVGLGKTIEAGLIIREMLLRRRVDFIVVAAPPSMTIQWKDELEAKFGLAFQIVDREHVAEMRRTRGFAVNPWRTGSRFIVSHRLLTDETYAAGLRDVLGEFRSRALFVLDEAHHAAPAGGSRYAISSQLTKVVRDLASRFEGFADADAFACLTRLRAGEKTETPTSPKIAEFDAFASGRPQIGHNEAGSKLFAETLPREAWCPIEDAALAGGIAALVAVHRLREVSCLYGFTRFEAAPTSTDGDFEDISLAVDGAPITRDRDWLPAVEQFGEGLFVHFDAAAIRAWLARPEVAAREAALRAGFGRWASKDGRRAPDYPGTAYILLHSLSHVLMSEIALDCGYPASSLKERVYALGGTLGGPPDRCGILIYTASAGAQGTLGGLVGTAPRFSRILRGALERTALCSNDPICADHEPDRHSGDRATHGAACHGCLLIAETSCENRNLLLDRALLVPTLSNAGVGFFRP